MELKCICSVSAQKSDLSTTVADQSKDLVAFFLHSKYSCIWNNVLSGYIWFLVVSSFTRPIMWSMLWPSFKNKSLFGNVFCSLWKLNFTPTLVWWLIFMGAKKYKSIHWSFEIGRCWQGANLIAYSPLLGTQQLFPLAAKLETAVESNPHLI